MSCVPQSWSYMMVPISSRLNATLCGDTHVLWNCRRLQTVKTSNLRPSAVVYKTSQSVCLCDGPSPSGCHTNRHCPIYAMSLCVAFNDPLIRMQTELLMLAPACLHSQGHNRELHPYRSITRVEPP